MFEEERLQGDSRGLALETRRFRAIRNVVEPEPDERARSKYALIRKKFGLRWTNRKPACGAYNCYGMVFAARRTSILDDSQIPDVLKDDGYRKIDEKDAMVGDLVFYQEGGTGQLLHVARITRRDPELGALFALSKWDSSTGEDEHHIRHHCWGEQNIVIDLEFWTDRPS